MDVEGLLDVEGGRHRHHPDVAELSRHHPAARLAQHDDVRVVHVDGVGALHQRERARIEEEGQRAIDPHEHQMVFLRPFAELFRHFPESASADQHLADGIAADVREGEHDAGDIVLEDMDLRHQLPRDHVRPGQLVQLVDADGQERAAGLGRRPGGQVVGVHPAR